MCGIAGIFAYKDQAPPVDEAELFRIREAMVKRGPDGAGSWVSPDRRIGLANRRLAIQDLSDAGAQPMATHDGRLRVTFNGEIYNHRQLRKELERKGYTFRSGSDTEVLLHLYADRGKEMVHALRGMYAFAIWDETEKSLFLARDPFGIKPLYYADEGVTLRFASQVKALLAGKAVDSAPESAGAVGFLLWGCVPEPFTLYRGIQAVPAGTCLTVQRGGTTQSKTHFSVREELVRAQADAKPFTPNDREELANALRDAVRHHLVSDVPVGVFLSAGVDSSLVTALVAEEQNVALRTLTLGFEEHRGTGQDEVPIAEQTAALRGTRHETRWIRSGDFEGEMQAILDAMDQPTTDGVNTYFVCREAARAGLKVALSGLGGDELFGGYPSFRDVPRLVRWMRPARLFPQAATLTRRTLAPLVSALTSPKYAGILEYGRDPERAYLLRRALFMPWELGDVLDRDAVAVGLERLQPLVKLRESAQGVRDLHARVAGLELSWYMRNQLLRDADWAGMAHSIEVRVPFVDVALFRAMVRWIGSGTPPRKADAAAAPRVALQAYILNRPKSGFSVPVRKWLTRRAGEGNRFADRGLRDWAREVYDSFQHDAFKDNAIRSGSREVARRRTAERILVFRIGQLGDTVVSLPALWAIRSRFPRSHITLLCDRQPDSRYVVAADLLRGTDLVDEFEMYNADASRPGRLRTYGHILLLLARLRASHFDKLVYLAPSARTAEQVMRDRRFFTAAGVREFIGMDAQSLPAMHEADFMLARLAAQGIPTPPPGEGRMDLQLGRVEERAVEEWLARLPGDGGRPWVGVGPGSKMPSKRWPLERYAEVVSKLIGQSDVWPVVFGGSEDHALGKALISRWGRGYNAAGALTVRSAAAALRRCGLHLGNDTGTMHLAAAVSTPCVAIFSAREVPGRWYPYGQGHAVLRAHIDCEGCGLVECVERKNECLSRVTAAQVLHACETMMTGQKR